MFRTSNGDGFDELTIAGRRFLRRHDTGQLIPCVSGSAEGDEEADTAEDGADGEEHDGEAGEEKAGEGAQKASAPVQPDPRDEQIKALTAALTRSDSQRDAMYDAAMASARAGNKPAEDDTPRITVSEQQIDDAYEAGDEKGARRLERKLHREELAVAEHRASKRAEAAVGGVASQINDVGIPAMASIVRSQIEASDPVAMKLPKHLRAKVDEYLNAPGTNPAARVNPEIVKRAYALVAGENLEEIVSAEVERRIRSGASGDGGAGTSRGRNAKADANASPTVEQMFGKDVAIDVDAQGGADKFAQRMGAKNWAEYASWQGGNA